MVVLEVSLAEEAHSLPTLHPLGNLILIVRGFPIETCLDSTLQSGNSRESVIPNFPTLSIAATTENYWKCPSVHNTLIDMSTEDTIGMYASERTVI